jgi:hypothetical protein
LRRAPSLPRALAVLLQPALTRAPPSRAAALRQGGAVHIAAAAAGGSAGTGASAGASARAPQTRQARAALPVLPSCRMRVALQRRTACRGGAPRLRQHCIVPKLPCLEPPR